MNGSVNVVDLDRDDIVWPFGGNPFIPLGARGHRRSVTVDPMPAYRHNYEVVRAGILSVTAQWPVSWPLTVYVLPVEDANRTNGSTFVDTDYSGDDPTNRPVTAAISLSAKRIMPHPAMSRYLAAHEYAHVLEDFINTAVRGNPLGGADTEREYAELRGLEVRDDGQGGGRWHDSPCEVMANDFRLLVAGVEPEYWPHPGVTHPYHLPELRGWWSDRLAEVKRKLEAPHHPFVRSGTEGALLCDVSGCMLPETHPVHHGPEVRPSGTQAPTAPPT